MNPEKIFLFNSSLPESSPDIGRKIKDASGWNMGNTFISYALLKILFGGPVKFAHLTNAWIDPLPHSLADEINRNFTHFIFIMQDYIREDFKTRPYEHINQFLEKIRIPVVPISLGANSFNGYDPALVSRLSKEQKRFLYLVSEKSPEIGVRGRYSAEVLDGLGIKNVRVTGAPSYFASGETRTVVKRPWDPAGVVTTGYYFNAGLPNSVHVLQDEAYFIDVLFLRGSEDRSDANPAARPFNEFDMQTWLHLHLKARLGLLNYFTDVVEWENFYKRKKWCLTVGSRLHSGIVSCNQAIPAIVTNGDARARESCEFLGIPYRPDLGSNSNIAEEYEKLDLSSMNQRYSSLHDNFIEYLKVHGLRRASSKSKGACFHFPQIEKPPALQVQESLNKGFDALTRFCSEKIRHCEEIEKNKQYAITRIQTTEERLQSIKERLQSTEERLRELEKFRYSKAGRLAAQLQILRHRALKAEQFLASRFKKSATRGERKKDAA